MPLTDTAVKNAKSSEKPLKLTAEKGLYLLVTRAGGKLWRLDYRFQDKRKTLALGQYPEISLKVARERRDEARKILAQGIDPGEARKEVKAAEQAKRDNTFGRIAEEWFCTWQAGKPLGPSNMSGTGLTTLFCPPSPGFLLPWSKRRTCWKP